jgi:hypothetical protein
MTKLLLENLNILLNIVIIQLSLTNLNILLKLDYYDRTIFAKFKYFIKIVSSLRNYYNKN